MKKIAIHSVPRSGSTWLGSIFDSHPKVIYKYQPLFSYEFKNRLTENSSLGEIEDFYNAISKSEDDFINQAEAKKRKIIPHFSKEVCEAVVYKEVRYHHILLNLLEKDSEIKIIGIIRNPLSTLSSWLKAPKEFRSDLGWSVAEEWRSAPKKNENKKEEFNGYEKWKEVANLFLKLKKEFPDNFYLVNYRQLLKDPINEVKEILAFCDLPMVNQTKEFITCSQSSENGDAYSVFRNSQKDDKWKNDLPEDIIDFIYKDLAGTNLEHYLKQ